MSPRAAIALTVLVSALLAVRLARMDPQRYSADAVHYLAAAERVGAHPGEVARPDYIGRRHPLFLASLAAVEHVAGPSLTPLVVLVYAGHLASCLLLGLLAARLGLPAPAPALGAFLLAVFPGANNLFADPIHFARTWNLALALAAILAALAGRGLVYVALYAATLLNFEDAVLLPLAVLALERLAPAAGGGRLAWPAHASALALLAASVVITASAPASAHPFALGLHVAVKVAMLPLEIAQAALVPRSSVVGPMAVRIAIAIATLALLLPRPAHVGATRRGALALLVLACAFAAPYLPRPTQGAWPSRYLYFPAAPLLALAGGLVAAAPARRRAAGLAVVALVGVTSTERAADVITSRHLLALASPRRDIHIVAAWLDPAGPAAYEPDASRLAFDPAFCDVLLRVHVPPPAACLPLAPAESSGTLGRGEPR